MCGVVAQLGKTAEFVEAFGAMTYRGTRGAICSSSRWGYVGHHRLPIVGLDAKYDQPVVDGKWTLAFVGEILNFRKFGSDESDLPVLVEAWKVFEKKNCFRDFDGFWSLVAIDEETGDLHMLTDYLGQKPLYYRGDVRACASEPAAVALLGPTTPDEIYFGAVAKWGYCPDTKRTPYREIRKTVPGEHVVIHQDGLVLRGLADWLEPAHGDLEEAIEEAVKLRVTSSDVPVAMLYSGGLDSSIVKLLAEQHGKIKHYFVEGCSEDNVPDDFHGDVCDASGVNLSTAVRVMQEPIDLGSLVPQIAMSDAVLETVCLTGDGADELFGGYGRAQRYDSQASDVYHELVNWHLPRLDRVMMRNAIEVRSPFLARGVAEIAFGLPYEKRRGKKILRDIYGDRIDAKIPKIPLRTAHVGHENTLKMIEIFRRKAWPKK
jgi:asparagine synthetase B (glutamine-hydrolysing)